MTRYVHLKRKEIHIKRIERAQVFSALASKELLKRTIGTISMDRAKTMKPDKTLVTE
jgi:hypothetical protein